METEYSTGCDSFRRGMIKHKLQITSSAALTSSSINNLAVVQCMIISYDIPRSNRKDQWKHLLVHNDTKKSRKTRGDSLSPAVRTSKVENKKSAAQNIFSASASID